jgi:carbonic anhydrase
VIAQTEVSVEPPAISLCAAGKPVNSNELHVLFAQNKAWAARMSRARPDFFTRLSQQQKPRYMWIGCSDSRVPANQITGLEPGEVFVHRNVGALFVHSDLNALSAMQFAVDQLKIQHVIVVGHYGCGAIQAALEDRRLGLADNWVRHIKEVRTRHLDLLEGIPLSGRLDALVELNVIEQVSNVCGSTVITDAWSAGQKVSVHGWAYGVHDGLLHDLGITASSTADVQGCWRAAVERVRLRKLPGC